MEAPVQHLDGIFSDERVMQFFIALKAIGDSCFRTLYELAQQKSQSVQNTGDTQSMFGRSLKKTVGVGLQYVNGWDDSIKEQEVMQARKQVPAIEGDYKHTLVQYLKQLHRNKCSHMRMKIPSFSTFLYSFLRRMANSEELRELQYFTSSFSDRDVYMREVLRQTLGQDCAPKTILLAEAPMEAEAASSGSSASSASSAEAEPSTRGVSLPATLTPIGNVPWEKQSYLQKEVTPDDSISNVPRASRRGSGGPPESQDPQDPPEPQAGLTRAALKRHQKRYAEDALPPVGALPRVKSLSQLLHGGPLSSSGKRFMSQVQMKSIPMGTTPIPAAAPPRCVAQSDMGKQTLGQEPLRRSRSEVGGGAGLAGEAPGEAPGGQDLQSQISAHPTVLSTFPVMALHSISTPR